MTPPTKAPLLYPLRIGDPELYVHPHPCSTFYHPYRCPSTGDILVANGYLALRIQRGLWHPSDYPPATSTFLERFLSLPWHYHQHAKDDWRNVDDIRGDIYRSAPVQVWQKNRRLHPSPVWQIGTTRARLSLLQLLARLPRLQINPSIREPAPIPFRFNPGEGLIAYDPRLQTHSHSIYPAHRDLLGGHELPHRTTPPPKFNASHLANWPPTDTTDTQP